MQLIALVARARNGVIGVRNQLPWHLPEDMQHFKAQTMGCPVILGRKTLESIGRELPGRKMIVLTRGTTPIPSYASPVNSLSQALHACKDAEKAFVIGGAEIYRLAMPRCDRLIITEIDADYVGDAWFAEPEPQDWIREERDERVSKNGIAFSINTYSRRTTALA